MIAVVSYLCSTSLVMISIWMCREKEYLLAAAAFASSFEAVRFISCHI